MLFGKLIDYRGDWDRRRSIFLLFICQGDNVKGIFDQSQTWFSKLPFFSSCSPLRHRRACWRWQNEGKNHHSSTRTHATQTQARLVGSSATAVTDSSLNISGRTNEDIRLGKHGLLLLINGNDVSIRSLRWKYGRCVGGWERWFGIRLQIGCHQQIRFE